MYALKAGAHGCPYWCRGYARHHSPAFPLVSNCVLSIVLEYELLRSSCYGTAQNMHVSRILVTMSSQGGSSKLLQLSDHESMLPIHSQTDLGCHVHIHNRVDSSH